MATFDEVRYNRNPDLHNKTDKSIGYLLTSERDSDNVEFVCNKYGWTPLYYFFHGWAALDWYRGYDKTFLIQPWDERTPTRTFIAPNRIIAGERRHRLEMLYWILNWDSQTTISVAPLCAPPKASASMMLCNH